MTDYCHLEDLKNLSSSAKLFWKYSNLSILRCGLQENLKQVLSTYRGQKGVTIPVLQKVQEELGYLPEDVISEVATLLGLSKNEVYGVATFYAQFRFEKPGEHTVKCCQGTACYVQGGRRILDAVESELKLASGKTTTDDSKFSLD